jgi:hypothetical protein
MRTANFALLGLIFNFLNFNVLNMRFGYEDRLRIFFWIWARRRQCCRNRIPGLLALEDCPFFIAVLAVRTMAIT